MLLEVHDCDSPALNS